MPWTLEDKDNWRETHLMGSYIWVIGGLLLIMLFPFFGVETYGIIFTIMVVAIALIPAAYSFYLYKQKS